MMTSVPSRNARFSRLLGREGEVKLADFGIAKAIGKREKSATGVIKGKFAYMSPEQSIGAELDARSDLFSVGTLLYILTTGKKPFEGTTDLDLLMQVRQARFEKPSTLVMDFNPDVERDLELQDVSLLSDRNEGRDDRAATAIGAGEASRPTVSATTPDRFQASDAGTRASSQTSQGAIGARSARRGADEAVGRASIPPGEPATGDGGQTKESVTRDAPPPPALLDDEAAFAAPTRIARAGRRLRRATIAMVAMLVLLAGTAYLAQPYLPPQLVGPVKAWLQRLPVAGRQIGDRARRLWDTL